MIQKVLAVAEETLTTGQMLDFFEAELKKAMESKKPRLKRVEGDMLDRGKSMADQHDELCMYNHNVERINALSTAIKMLRCGEWDGINCYNEACGEPIPFKRQQFAPGIYCVKCKSALEVAAKQKGRR